MKLFAHGAVAFMMYIVLRYDDFTLRNDDFTRPALIPSTSRNKRLTEHSIDTSTRDYRGP